MGRKIMIVVDMQNDFVIGVLGSQAAVDTIPHIIERLNEYDSKNDYIYFTRDSHFRYYMETLEGKKLPIPHCIIGTDGWKICPELNDYATKVRTINKFTFGADWGYELTDFDDGDFDSIELCGVCTDICVVSNALILRAMFPNTPIKVYANACAGTSPEAHEAALKVMESCQIDVIR